MNDRINWRCVTPARRSQARARAGSDDSYDDVLASQNGVCAICGSEPQSKALSYDHDHETGLLRGLLCQPCNVGLGMFKDDPERLAQAIRYLGRAVVVFDD